MCSSNTPSGKKSSEDALLGWIVSDFGLNDAIESGLVKTPRVVVQHIWEAIRFENTTNLTPVFDSHRPLMSTADMRPWFTYRPCEHTKRSHINMAVYDSRWEASEAYALDHSDLVESWVKNDNLGFEILYVYRGVVRKYRPDFLVRMEVKIVISSRLNTEKPL